VRTEGQRRMVSWTMDLRQWVLDSMQGKLHPGSDEADYELGVMMAINVSQGKIPPLNEALLVRQPRETQLGYVDGITLMNKVVELGDAPVGEFRELLGAPHSEPLSHIHSAFLLSPTARRWKPWESFRGTARSTNDGPPFIVGRL
jgi:hypothetical protein